MREAETSTCNTFDASFPDSCRQQHKSISNEQHSTFFLKTYQDLKWFSLWNIFAGQFNFKSIENKGLSFQNLRSIDLSEYESRLCVWCACGERQV